MSTRLVKILKLKLRRDLKLEFGQFFLLMFCRGYVESKFNLSRDSEARFCQDFEAIVLWRGWCLVEILKLMLGQNSEI